MWLNSGSFYRDSRVTLFISFRVFDCIKKQHRFVATGDLRNPENLYCETRWWSHYLEREPWLLRGSEYCGIKRGIIHWQEFTGCTVNLRMYCNVLSHSKPWAYPEPWFWLWICGNFHTCNLLVPLGWQERSQNLTQCFSADLGQDTSFDSQLGFHCMEHESSYYRK